MEKEVNIQDAFQAARRLSSEAGFKIFTPSPKYFRSEDQFIAASNDTQQKGIFRLWIKADSLWIEFYPFYENTSHKTKLENALAVTIKQRSSRSAMRRFTTTHSIVIAAQHAEFDMLVTDVRLP